VSRNDGGFSFREGVGGIFSRRTVLLKSCINCAKNLGDGVSSCKRCVNKLILYTDILVIKFGKFKFLRYINSVNQFMMIHTCNVHCHAHDSEELELLGISDQGKWLPFSFMLDIVIAIKLSTDDEDNPTFNCTTVFTDRGDSYIIDTPFYTFRKLWTKHFTTEQNEETGPEL
jgi:hypothetical protein